MRSHNGFSPRAMTGFRASRKRRRFSQADGMTWPASRARDALRTSLLLVVVPDLDVEDAATVQREMQGQLHRVGDAHRVLQPEAGVRSPGPLWSAVFDEQVVERPQQVPLCELRRPVVEPI